MTGMKSLTLIAACALGLAGQASAMEPPRDHDRALEGVANKRVLTLRQIENRLLPQMGGADYLGPEYDGDASVYRLKFIRAGRVFWVDVDARTGDVIGRSGR